jgi:hypothetical protein
MVNNLITMVSQKSYPAPRGAGFSATRGIANKGFRGMRRFLARFNFSCNLIGNRPQSLTGHTANVKHQRRISIKNKFE